MPSGIHRSDARLSYSRLYRQIDGIPRAAPQVTNLVRLATILRNPTESGSTSEFLQYLTRRSNPSLYNRQELCHKRGQLNRCNSQWRKGWMPGSRFQFVSMALTRPHDARYQVRGFGTRPRAQSSRTRDSIRDFQPSL